MDEVRPSLRSNLEEVRPILEDVHRNLEEVRPSLL